MQKKSIRFILIIFFQLICWQILFRISPFVDFWIVNVIPHYQSLIHSINTIFPRATGEIFYAFLLIVILIISYKSVKSKNIILILKGLFIIIFIYNSLWGIMYYRKNFVVYKSLKIDVDKLKILYKHSLQQAIKSRELISNDDKNLQIDLTVYDYLTEFNKQQKNIKNEQWILNQNQIKNPKVVFSQFSNLLSYSGVLGYYNPFIVESNINYNISDLKFGSTIFHELAHQMGYASESEANFIAYYIGESSKFPEIVYFTNYKLIFYLLNLIGFSDPEYAKYQLKMIPKVILEDRKAEIDFYSKYEGKVNDSFSFMNNQFLKLNNQDGLISYSKYIELVYYYHFEIKKASNN